MEISEDKLIELEMTSGIHQDDVATFIDANDTLEGLVSDLKDYFKLDEEYYADRAKFKALVEHAKSLDSETIDKEKDEAMKAFDKFAEEEGL